MMDDENNDNGFVDLEALDVPFDEEVADLAACKDNVLDFENKRKELHKKTGVRLGKIDEAVGKLTGGDGRGPSQADTLINIGTACRLFHSSDDTAYADIDVHGHRETIPVRGRLFKRYLARGFYEEMKSAANNDAMTAALGVLEAMAHFDGDEIDVAVRVAGLNDSIFIDLGGPVRNAVEVGPGGWCVIDEPPVRFRRSSGMKEIPAPERGGSIDDLRMFLNVKSDQDFILLVCWLLAALRHHGPFPVIAFTGEQGSAKSTACGLLKALVDPNAAPLRSLPGENRDLYIAANNSHALCFDNLSGLSAGMSDNLCRLATGAGFSARQLFSDIDEQLFHGARPVLLNGIEDFVGKPDLADRTLFIELSAIDESKRKPESEIWAEFAKLQPKLFGVLLDAMAHGLKMLPTVKLQHLPRMADFAKWAAACETFFWPAGTFEAAYTGNRNEAVETVIEADLVATAIRLHVNQHGSWSGTSSELLEVLGNHVSDSARKSKAWPNSPRGLSGKVRRAATFLRKIGIDVDFLKTGSSRARTIALSSRAENTGLQPSQPSAPSAHEENPQKTTLFENLNADGMRTVRKVADGTRTVEETPTVRTETAEYCGETGSADGADGYNPPFSGGETEGVL